jgi:hypothetical protein
VRRNRRTLYLIALVTLAPVVASYTIYYWFPPERQVNYGELLPTVPAPAIVGAARDGSSVALADLRGKWLLVVTAPGGCDAGCRGALYATRQVRTIQGREMERVRRLWLVTDEAPPDAALLAEHADLRLARVKPEAARALTGPGSRLILVDPLGNLVLAYPRDPDIKSMAKDLTRLLKASRIG